jgi:hypothetical protein
MAVAALLFSSAAHAGTPISLTDFSGESEVTVSGNGGSASFVEVGSSSFVRLTNDPYVGDAEVIVPGASTALSFDYTFDEAPGSDDEFSAVLFTSGAGGGPYHGKLVRKTIPSTQSGTMTFDLSPYVGQSLGLEFEMLDLPGGDDTTNSTLTVSNVMVPEPSLWMSIASGCAGLLALHRRGLA